MTELLIILVLATIVVGPEKMIEFAGQMGRWLAKFRSETRDITREFRDAFDMELGEFKQELDEVRHDLNDLKDVQETLSTPLDASQGASRGRPAYNLPTQSGRPGRPAYNLPTGPQGVQPTPAQAAAVAGAAATSAAAQAPRPVPAPETPPAPEMERDLSPDAEAIEIPVGVLMGEDEEADGFELEGPVLVEDLGAEIAPARRGSREAGEGAREEL